MPTTPAPQPHFRFLIEILGAAVAQGFFTPQSRGALPVLAGVPPRWDAQWGVLWRGSGSALTAILYHKSFTGITQDVGSTLNSEEFAYFGYFILQSFIGGKEVMNFL